jgi:exopolyphosphatase/pppGpp-phosphohydrolase
MSDPDPLTAAERIGVIDLGSNSLRLVVFERLGAAGVVSPRPAA